MIWTRLAPEPLLPRAMPILPVEVSYEIGDDPGMTRVVQTGRAIARIELAHSVHAR